VITRVRGLKRERGENQSRSSVVKTYAKGDHLFVD
jgi:hypothetical protein